MIETILSYIMAIVFVVFAITVIIVAIGGLISITLDAIALAKLERKKRQNGWV